MRIEIHPKPDGMQHVNLMFCEDAPDPEDQWVRELLTRYPVPPKRYLDEERDGRPYRTWQYGECAIADALFYITRYKGTVDRLLAGCAADLEQAALPAAERNALIQDLALEFHHQARFTLGPDGEMTVTVDTTPIRARLRERLAAA